MGADVNYAAKVADTLIWLSLYSQLTLTLRCSCMPALEF